MAEKQVGKSFSSSESSLKALAVEISDNNKDYANRVYEVMRGFLLDKKKGETPSSHYLLNIDRNSQEAMFKLDYDFLSDRRSVLQYLETVDPVSARKFADFTDDILNEKNIDVRKMWPLKFIIAMARKRNSDELIIEKKVKSSLPRLRPIKGKAPLPPPSGSKSPSPSLPPKASSSYTPESNGCYRKVSEPRPQESVLKCSRVNEVNYNLDVGGGLSEWDVIEGLLFVWQGVPSKIFRRDEKTQNYILHEKWRVYPWVREQADNLASLGYLHDCLLPYGECPREGGLIRKCFAAFIRNQLSEYYALIAAVRTEFQKQSLNDPRAVNGLTLERLRLQSTSVARTLMDLISIAEFSSESKGGYLASSVYSFIRHGDPNLQNLVKSILAEICEPLYAMLTKWLIEGTVNDQSKEFFIAADSVVGGDLLWQEKYSIRMSMLPEFFPVQLADKVLSVGRCINFLRERCQNEQPFAEPEKIRSLFRSHSVEVMYLTEHVSDLENLVSQAYEETNKRVLEVLLSKYALLDHFQAHRKILLLGQGDFIHHLMDLMMEVLEKPANQLHPHYLNSILDSAVRATTAQFEPEDIIKRVDAATLIHSEGEIGWDVFYLRYHVDGPIGTVFSPSSRNEYQKLFCALWKAKRMEMILSKLWKHQITSSKILRRIGELGPILRQCHELTAEMLHFIRQTQYYFLFEVLECSWNHLIDEVRLAVNLDAVIEAHSEFLAKVTAGVFMDETHQKLSLKLRLVYNLILSLESQVDKLLHTGEKEARERSVAATAGLSETVDGSKVDYLKRRRDFVQRFLPAAAGELRVLASTYRNNVKKFLLMLNSEEDLNLQLLSVRLDFNSHYKQLDSRLEAPLTFQHRRMSSIGGDMSPILTRKFSGERRLEKKRDV